MLIIKHFICQKNKQYSIKFQLAFYFNLKRNILYKSIQRPNVIYISSLLSIVKYMPYMNDNGKNLLKCITSIPHTNE